MLNEGYYVIKIEVCSICKGSGEHHPFGNCKCIRSLYPRRKALQVKLTKEIIEEITQQPKEENHVP